MVHRLLWIGQCDLLQVSLPERRQVRVGADAVAPDGWIAKIYTAHPGR